MAQYTLLTQAGYEKMKADVDVLRSVGRKEAAAAIAEAREKGDLSENAEYDAAKDAQGLLEAKIADLEGKLGNARIIDESQLDDSKVSVLSTVTIENVKLKKQVTYKLVPESEADLKSGKISVNSPGFLVAMYLSKNRFDCSNHGDTYRKPEPPPQFHFGVNIYAKEYYKKQTNP